MYFVYEMILHNNGLRVLILYTNFLLLSKLMSYNYVCSLARIFKDVSVFSVMLSFIVPYHCIDCKCMQMYFEP